MTEKYIRKSYPETVIAYMAGIVDGEGGLTIGSYTKGPTGNPWYATYLTISSTDKPLIDWLVENFGSKLQKYTRSQMAKNCRRQVFRWQVSGDRLHHICELIHPYSVIKKRQIEIIIEFLDTSKTRIYEVGQRGPRISPEIYDLRTKLCSELRSFHVRHGPLIIDN